MAKCCIFKFLNFIAMDLFAIQERSVAKPGRIEIIQNRIVDDSDANLILPNERHRNGNKRNVTNEIVCPIDWIYDPSWAIC